jgi:CO/xanthine dehydrogenase FAD-binding subunit
VEYYVAKNLAQALELKAAHPDATCVQGGTDVMVGLNLDHGRPTALLDLSRVTELHSWERVNGHVNLGAGVSYTRICNELADLLPGLAMASRTVGSLQIRNKGGVGGNLGTASPAGDAHPALLATGATIHAASVRGNRAIDIDDFFLAPKKSALEPDELITSITIPVATGGQQYTKIGTRNAMVIAVASFGVAIDQENRKVGAGIGSAGPTPIRPREAEALAQELPWDSMADLSEELTRRFGELVAAAARPIDDIRGTAAYRRHTLAVIARRTLTWAWNDTRNHHPRNKHPRKA